ncbi:MAG: type II toxin-antitoxin system prevent-host-death family antitoxin [Acidobacteriaceae bacterium]|nr:type II toxin-antitoxin system prevent-host-death family antitoxin [Acidobacteriaceae bacterium]
MHIGIKDAKADLSRIIQSALDGDTVVITRRGKPLVRLVPETPKPTSPNRAYGSLRSVFESLPEGWDSPEADEEVIRLFEGLR